MQEGVFRWEGKKINPMKALKYIGLRQSDRLCVFGVDGMHEKDFCVKCGSENIRLQEKEMEVKFPNPGTIHVKQACSVCQDCGDSYMDRSQISELSKKVSEERHRLESSK